jgi:hypothetical protein
MARTNAFSLLCVIIRVFALWLIIKLVFQLPSLIVGVDQATLAGMNPWLFAIPLAAGTLLAALLWLFADKFARLALTRPQDHVFESDLDASTWLGLIVAGIGAWYFFAGLLDGASLGMQAVLYDRYSQEYGRMDLPPDFKVAVARAVLQLVVGAILALGGRGLAALLHKLRYAGLRRGQGQSGDEGQVPD